MSKQSLDQNLADDMQNMVAIVVKCESLDEDESNQSYVEEAEDIVDNRTKAPKKKTTKRKQQSHCSSFSTEENYITVITNSPSKSKKTLTKNIFKCNVCEKTFATAKSMEYHKLRVHDITSKRTFHQCNFSENLSDSQCALEKHMLVHTSQKPFHCKICKMSFSHKFAMIRHKDSIHGKVKYPSTKSFGCTVCEKQFPGGFALQSHIRTHTGEKPFQCKFCSRAFAQSSDLKAHIRIHTGDKPYPCAECGKAFTTAGRLKTHMRCHAPVKPFQCSVCERGFTRSCHLYRHIATHFRSSSHITNNYIFAYVCKVCDKPFALKSTLTEHELSHASERRFKCLDCDKAYKHPSALKSHRKLHDETINRPNLKTFPCFYCDRIYNHNSSLHYHLSTHKK
ncbi:unnamed protein product [Clavelina lepadiformis]|uniref:C2H2-type domain-containing protein n=1 Tax=Clavelina lepadiformis TaxID=159417 RepID=A0ABP0GH84_CLALP